MWERLKVAALCALLVFSCVVHDAQAVTIPTRVLNGVHVYAPAPGAEIVNAIGFAVRRASPWIGALSLGVEIGRFVFQTVDGQIAVTTSGRAIAEQAGTSTAVTAPTTLGITVSYSACAGGGTLLHQGTISAICSASAAHANSPCTCGSPAGSRCGYAIKSYPTQTSCVIGIPQDNNANYTLAPSFQCPTGYSLTGAGTCVSTTGNNGGGNPSTAWSPAVVTDPATGGKVMGWAGPTDPALNPQPFTPADNFQQAPLDTGQAAPQVTVTPNVDGGVTVSTWAPEAPVTDPVTGQPQPTLGTLQSVTINNAGNVTNITNITNVGPPPAANTTPAPVEPLVCGSLSCESTQQQIHTDTTAIKTELIAAGAPTLPDQTAVMQSAKDEDKNQSDAISNAITTDTSFWTAWVWTPPAGTCTAPSATLHGGVTVSFDYCPMVGNIKDVLGWLFAIFGSWHVWNVLFRRGD
jgi:hypothetical protein